jgi:oxygen-independent coproporphyrinogen-3 oxidase
VVYGLPYQTADSLRATLKALLSLAPDRLATFYFMYTPWDIKHQRAIPPSSVPTPEERVRLYETLEEVSNHGYTRVGCDHWVRGGEDPLGAAAQSGGLVYGFQGYEPLSRETVLGFGSSAISFAGGRYFQNLRDIKRYQASLGERRISVETNRSATLSAEDKLRHHVILKQILSDLRIDKDAVERRFGVRFDEHFAPELARLREMAVDGLVQNVDERSITVTPLGRAFIRNVAWVFDQHLTSDKQVRLNVVPSPRE